MSTPGSRQLIGCHASVWTGQFDAEGLETAFRGSAEAGFNLIELPLFAPREWDVASTVSLAAEYGLAISASLGLTDELNISSEDEGTVRRGEEHLTAVLQVLHELGSSHLCGVIYGPMKKHMRPVTELEVRNGQAALGRPGGDRREPGHPYEPRDRQSLRDEHPQHGRTGRGLRGGRSAPTTSGPISTPTT